MYWRIWAFHWSANRSILIGPSDLLMLDLVSSCEWILVEYSYSHSLLCCPDNREDILLREWSFSTCRFPIIPWWVHLDFKIWYSLFGSDKWPLSHCPFSDLHKCFPSFGQGFNCNVCKHLCANSFPLCSMPPPPAVSILKYEQSNPHPSSDASVSNVN